MQREKDEWLARFVDEAVKAIDEKSLKLKKQSLWEKIFKKKEQD